MWFLALKQLLDRKKQTAFIVGGILLGTAAYVAFSGMMLGMQSFIVKQLIESGSAVHVSAKEEDILPHSLDDEMFGDSTLVDWKKFPSGRRDYARIENPQGWFDLLENDPRVIAYSQQLNVQALAQRSTITLAVQIKGVDPYRQERVTNINDYILNNGRLSDIGRSGNRVIVGTLLMQKLGASIGESILLSSANGKPLSFKIINTFETGSRMIDQTTVYASLADAQKLNRTPSQISDIAIRLADVETAADWATGYSHFVIDKVQSWDQENQSIFSVFRMQTIIRNLMSVCILLVAGFGIYNILNMLIFQKRREIGILRSMGYTGRDVSSLFLYQGVIFGFIGGVLGIVIGYLACRYLATIEIASPMRTGFRRLEIDYRLSTYVKAFVMAFGSSLIAGWVPARSAGKMNLIETIRSEG